MISTFPWTYLKVNGFDSLPFFGGPVKGVDRIEAFLSLSSTGKEYKSIVLFIVVESSIGSGFGNVSSGFFVLPFEGQSAENPDIVHIVGIYVIVWITCISAKYY
jgi:hypothetical protein